MVCGFHHVSELLVLVKEVPPDTEFHFCRVDWIGVCREIIPAAKEFVKVFVFNKQVGSFYI